MTMDDTSLVSQQYSQGSTDRLNDHDIHTCLVFDPRPPSSSTSTELVILVVVVIRGGCAGFSRFNPSIKHNQSVH